MTPENSIPIHFVHTGRRERRSGESETRKKFKILITETPKRPRLGRGKARRGGRSLRREAVPHELKRKMQVGKDSLNGFLELLGLILVHGGCPASSPHAVEDTHEAGED